MLFRSTLPDLSSLECDSGEQTRRRAGVSWRDQANAGIVPFPDPDVWPGLICGHERFMVSKPQRRCPGTFGSGLGGVTQMWASRPKPGFDSPVLARGMNTTDGRGTPLGRKHQLLSSFRKLHYPSETRGFRALKYQSAWALFQKERLKSSCMWRA